ncbi:uncharacterized protein LOC103309443 [Acyrthosiphon pisum]|uniref:Zinc finger MYM-type 1-like n=1 Tax=Acyrthosiphon pisum TaxID=7029 RepID=A0A8R2F8R5_ACYPI|nr:uncharacterized protein LOC103309443 [Acyrthosiphon pisum]|eukprot:XP_008183115.1 PREDICTED: uncharacterized protein LOC103309443 [Acyrthosiphon pisum]
MKSGSFSGLQKRICEIVPNATFMHCCSHNINLIICDAAKSSRKVQSFFEIVQDIFNFFSSSGPRWTDLAFGEEEGTVIRKVVLKKLCATRWEARHNALYSLRMRFVDILKALTKLQLTSTKKNERDMALALKKKLESPEFILILCVWENILKSMQFVSKKLQSVDLHLQQALDQLNTAISDIKLMRENYDTIVDKAKKMCDSWSIPFTFHQSRERYSKLFPGEIDGDRRLTITQDNFKVTVFYPVIDTILSQLKFRFTGLNTVCDYFRFLIPFSMISMTKELLIRSTYDFIEKYRDDISSDFTRQIVSLQDFFSFKG